MERLILSFLTPQTGLTRSEGDLGRISRISLCKNRPGLPDQPKIAKPVKTGDAESWV
jgi:hypothetical protein